MLFLKIYINNKTRTPNIMSFDKFKGKNTAVIKKRCVGLCINLFNESVNNIYKNGVKIKRKIGIAIVVVNKFVTKRK